MLRVRGHEADRRANQPPSHTVSMPTRTRRSTSEIGSVCMCDSTHRLAARARRLDVSMQSTVCVNEHVTVHAVRCVCCKHATTDVPTPRLCCSLAVSWHNCAAPLKPMTACSRSRVTANRQGHYSSADPAVRRGCTLRMRQERPASLHMEAADILCRHGATSATRTELWYGVIMAEEV